MDTDVNQALREVENSLRDFIAYALEKRFGSDWINKCGAPTDRIDNWRDRRATEVKRQRAGAVEDRLLYYADF